MIEIYYLQNERIYLRAVEPTDLEIMYDIENDPSLWEVTSFTVPYSRYILEQYILNSANDLYIDKQLRLMIVRKLDNQTLGIIDITDFVPLHNRGAVGIAICDSYRKNGYAGDALRLLCQYAFGYLHLNQLYAHIPCDNTASISLFASCDFLKTGLLKDWIHADGSYKDIVVMQKIG